MIKSFDHLKFTRMSAKIVFVVNSFLRMDTTVSWILCLLMLNMERENTCLTNSNAFHAETNPYKIRQSL